LFANLEIVILKKIEGGKKYSQLIKSQITPTNIFFPNHPSYKMRKDIKVNLSHTILFHTKRRTTEKERKDNAVHLEISAPDIGTEGVVGVGELLDGVFVGGELFGVATDGAVEDVGGEKGIVGVPDGVFGGGDDAGEFVGEDVGLSLGEDGTGESVGISLGGDNVGLVVIGKGTQAKLTGVPSEIKSWIGVRVPKF